MKIRGPVAPFIRIVPKKTLVDTWMQVPILFEKKKKNYETTTTRVIWVSRVDFGVRYLIKVTRA